MSFKILYIEDEISYSEEVEYALAQHAEKVVTRTVFMKSITTPDQLSIELDNQYDLVLADACFPDSFGGETNRLQDIIEIVKAWSKANQLDKPLPIIAYTRRDKGALNFCLEHRNDLFDIWDKSSASPSYAAWRMTRIASEVARSQPDSLLQRLIRQMPTGARWHEHVVKMTRDYSSGWTESDQIERVKSSIGAIGMDMGVAPQCKAMWEIMQKWEPLSRAVSENARGHARHVLNVFWLGYYLLHHPKLRSWFRNAWPKVVVEREGMGSVKNADPLEALSDCWFYAGLFHDIAGCIEKNAAVTGKANTLFTRFREIITLGEPAHIVSETITKAANDIFSTLKPMRDALLPEWSNSLSHNKPDHGVLAAVHIVTAINIAQQSCFAREAARAMVVHNLIAKIPHAASLPISWDTEPIVCMLLLCDQIQTWDRERGTEKLSDQDGSERAELVAFSIDGEAEKVQVDLAIDYLGPRHLDHAPVIFDRVKHRLENVLQDFPHSALSRIVGPWPFSLDLKCSLNGRPLNSLKFGIPH